MQLTSPLTRLDRIRCAGVVVAPVTFISAWAVSGAITAGYSPIRDHISDLAAVDAPTRPLMNASFVAFAAMMALAAGPMRRWLGTPAAAVMGANAGVSIAIALAPLGVSPDGDRLHNVVAGLGYLALAAMAPSAAPALARQDRRLAAASVGVGAVTLACLIASLVLTGQAGLWQRAGITTTDAWLIAIGLLAVTSRSAGRT